MAIENAPDREQTLTHRSGGQTAMPAERAPTLEWMLQKKEHQPGYLTTP